MQPYIYSASEGNMNRRLFMRTFGAVGLGSRLRLQESDATPTPAESSIISIASGTEIAPGVVLDHFRVVRSEYYDVLVLGAFVNGGSGPIDLPSSLDVVTRDRAGVILGSGYVSPDYPILPVKEKIGFTAALADVVFDEVDPLAVSIEALDDTVVETRVVHSLLKRHVQLEQANEISRADHNLVIECVVTNASESEFEHGVDPRFSVWDANGFYCGHAFENVTMRIRPGDSVRFRTHSYGGFINPLEIAGEDFTWTPWITPR